MANIAKHFIGLWHTLKETASLQADKKNVVQVPTEWVDLS